MKSIPSLISTRESLRAATMTQSRQKSTNQSINQEIKVFFFFLSVSSMQVEIKFHVC